MTTQDSLIVTLAKTGSDFQMQYVVVDGEPWFKGKTVANVLGYIDTKQAISHNVDSDDRKKLNELMGVWATPMDYHTAHSVFINESGLYSLILRSQKE